LNNCVRCNPDNDYLCAECKSSSLLNHDGECVEPPTIETIGDTFVGYRKFAGDGEERFTLWGPSVYLLDYWLNTNIVFDKTKPLKLFSTPGGKHSHLAGGKHGHLGRDCINSNDPSKTEIQICALAVLTIDGVSFSREDPNSEHKKVEYSFVFMILLFLSYTVFFPSLSLILCLLNALRLLLLRSFSFVKSVIMYEDGDSSMGGVLITREKTELSKNTRSIHVGGHAFAALLNNRNVLAWGDPLKGGRIPFEAQEKLVGVTAIESTESAFAAIVGTQTVVAWGDVIKGGSIPDITQSLLVDVQEITSTSFGAFAARLASGKVVVWGAQEFGGKITNPEIQKKLDSGVRKVYATSVAFAAILDSGSVVAWGANTYDTEYQGQGNITSGTAEIPTLVNVRSIITTQKTFIALLDDGKIIGFGGDIIGKIPNDLQQGTVGGGVRMVIPLKPYTEKMGERNISGINSIAFAALLNDGTVRAFGGEGPSCSMKMTSECITEVLSPNGKCNSPNSVTQEKLINVKEIVATEGAFAALKTDGTVVAWGDREFGGVIPDKSYARWSVAKEDFRAVGGPDKDDYWPIASRIVGTTKIVGSSNAFAALVKDPSDESVDSIVGWGGPNSLVVGYPSFRNDDDIIWTVTTSDPQFIEEQKQEKSVCGNCVVQGIVRQGDNNGRLKVALNTGASLTFFFNSAIGQTFDTSADIQIGSMSYDTKSGVTTQTFTPSTTILHTSLASVSPDAGNGYFIPLMPSKKFNTELLACPMIGYYPNEKSCVACPPGKSTPLRGSTECTACPTGKISVLAAVSCSYCTPGMFDKVTEDGLLPCRTCPSGYIQNSSAAPNAKCFPCVRDTYLAFDHTSSPTNHDSLEDCITCASGQFSQPGASFCSPCFAGKYFSDTSLRCESCPAGWKQEQGQQTKCDPCAVGTFQDKQGQPYCLICEVGKYQSTTGQAWCFLCPSNLIADTGGATECTPCDASSGRIPNKKRSACERPAWKVPRDCKRYEEYLHDTTNISDKMSWDCINCPPGGSCHDNSSTTNLLPKDGWL
jgi:hypothetical protein